jgi:hypothetical protein
MASIQEQAACLTVWVSAVACSPGAVAAVGRQTLARSSSTRSLLLPRAQLNGFTDQHEAGLHAYRDGGVLLCVAQDV